MLKDRDSAAIVAVRDIEQARDFYTNTLGLDIAEEIDGVLTFRTGKTFLVVYQSAEAGSNRANAVVWNVGEEIDAIVASLRANGVPFEHYPEMEGVELDGDVHVAGMMRLVWFKDPDGNILHLNSM